MKATAAAAGVRRLGHRDARGHPRELVAQGTDVPAGRGEISGTRQDSGRRTAPSACQVRPPVAARIVACPTLTLIRLILPITAITGTNVPRLTRRPPTTPCRTSPRTPSSLSQVVRFDRPRLGDLTGLRAVHLQCHIGTDTISLARLGAAVTGLDFSPASIAAAGRWPASTGTEASFVEADVYDAPDVLGRGNSTWSIPASAPCAGCPASAAGQLWSRPCCGQAAVCSSATATR